MSRVVETKDNEWKADVPAKSPEGERLEATDRGRSWQMSENVKSGKDPQKVTGNLDTRKTTRAAPQTMAVPFRDKRQKIEMITKQLKEVKCQDASNWEGDGGVLRRRSLAGASAKTLEGRSGDAGNPTPSDTTDVEDTAPIQELQS